MPGVRHALIARQGSLDAAFCRGPACAWCADVDALRAGERRTFSGEAIWSAMFDGRHPDAWAWLMDDRSLYMITGPDSIEPWRDEPTATTRRSA